MLIRFLFACWMAVRVSAATETTSALIGYSPELNALFWQTFSVPDDGRCIGYILDLDKKVKWTLPPQADIRAGVVAMGEGDELSSCALRAFDVQLELKLKTEQKFEPELKQKLEPYLSVNWSKSISGFGNKSISSMGLWLKSERASWAKGKAAKLFELGATEAEDSNWLDAYDALALATDLDPKMTSTSKEMKDLANKIREKAASETNAAKAELIFEVAIKLNAKDVSSQLHLAPLLVRNNPERAFRFVQKSLSLDPVLTTRIYREDASFSELRCDPKFERNRKRLPEVLVQGVNCK